ncbi:uncharacterized protein LOC128955615 [Oppia nitens]|uniref:uncharacterized protein LOC128955615 n=1 Tax=Oppia nitens TaxID=1686743 RepID=UPI0023DCE1DC|nr:uncharacterized protein LOC128955615 [Oppia nitens]
MLIIKSNTSIIMLLLLNIYFIQQSIGGPTRLTNFQFIQIYGDCKSSNSAYKVDNLVHFVGQSFPYSCDKYKVDEPTITRRYLMRYNGNQWAPVVVEYTDLQNIPNNADNKFRELQKGKVVDGLQELIGAQVVYDSAFNLKWFDTQCQKPDGVTQLRFKSATVQINVNKNFRIQCKAKLDQKTWLTEFMVTKIKPGLVSEKLLNKL